MNALNMAFRLYNLMSRNRLYKSVLNLETASRTGIQADALPLLQHAVDTVPYYHSLAKDEIRLQQFPVVNKDIIKASPEQFLSTAFKKSELVEGKTSGTHGMPFFFYWDKQKALSRTAEVIFHNAWIGYRVGDLHLLNAVGLKKSKFKLFLQNEIVKNPRYICDQWMEEQRRTLIDQRIPFYIGYGSVIDRFSRFCRARGDKPETFYLKGIISTAEHLPEQARARAEEVFGCPVLRRYATLETGILAHECPEGRKYHINNGNYHVEFLKKHSDAAAPAGEVARIVVTDLRALAMPLIRYDIGDLAVVDSAPCSCGRKSITIKELMGRTADNLVNDQGEPVSWLAINDAMWTVSGIQRFQFVQHDYSLCDLNVVSKTGYDQKQLKQVAKSLLGESITIRFRDVDAIDALASGKTPNIVSRIGSRSP